MLKNKKIVYFCQECGYESSKWMGQCPACKEWNTMVEEPTAKRESVPGRAFGSAPAGRRGMGEKPSPVRLDQVSLDEQWPDEIKENVTRQYAVGRSRKNWKIFAITEK